MSTINARVTTSSGRPVGDAVLTVMSQSGDQHALVRTDAEGGAGIADVGVGTYTVVVTAPGYQPSARVAVVSGGGPVSLGTVALTRAGSAPVPAPGHWEIDTGHSVIEIAVRHLGIATVKGRFTDFTGSIEVAEDVERSTVVAEIKTASIDTDNASRDASLRSDAFFGVDQHPVAMFRAGSVRPATDETWSLSGTLTLRGSEVPVELEMTYLGTEDDPWGGRRAGFRATGTLHRGDFGISFDDKLISGVAQISSTATVTLDIEAVHQPS